jgi:hypothetical protein
MPDVIESADRDAHRGVARCAFTLIEPVVYRTFGVDCPTRRIVMILVRIPLIAGSPRVADGSIRT